MPTFSVVDDLVSMGFSRDLALLAVEETRQQHDGSASMQAALDWLVRHSSSSSVEPPPSELVRSSTSDAESLLLQAAINESLQETSTATVHAQVVSLDPFPNGPTTTGALSEDEQLQLAIDQSMNEAESSRRRSMQEIQEQMAAMSAVPSAFVTVDPEPESSEPPPAMPESFVFDPAEEVVRRRLERRAPGLLVLSKAAVVLRRHASVARQSRQRTLSNAQVASLDPFPNGPTTDPVLSPRVSVDEVQGLPAVEASIVKGKDLLAERLRFLRLQSVSVNDDGNCQFRAFSQQLFGSEAYHHSIRLELVEHMQRESTFFGSMFDEGELETYLAAMRLPRTWGDELTLRAFSDCYHVCVHVVTSTDGEHWHLCYEPQGEGAAKKHCFLTYLSPVHYDALTAEEPLDVDSPMPRGK